MTTPNGRAGDWRRTEKNRPCPVCKRFGWCRLTADGRLSACRYVEAGCWKKKTDKNGAPVFLHCLGGAGPSDPPAPSGPGAERAEAGLLDRVYSAVLAGLQLSEAHREALRRRGLSDDEIDRRRYRTLPRHGRARLARELQERFGDELLAVPGLVRKQGGDGQSYVTVAGAAGLVVPVRDPAGRIAALQVRRDDSGAGPRYSYLSSVKQGGPGPGTPAHVPLGIQAPADVVRLTEGAIKADVAVALSGLPTVGTAGAGNWRPALGALQALGCKTARLAFDSDALDNAHVASSLAACSEALAGAGLAVELERWPAADGKGIDDLLLAGKAPEVLAGEAARVAIAGALAAATAGESPQDSGPLDRLDAVLADGGPETLYRDGELLRALARLAEDDPGEFACRRAQLQRAGVKLRDLDRALAPLRQEIRHERPPPDAAGCYRVSGGRIVREVLTKDGPLEVALTNWSGRIVEQTVHDDGGERRLTFAVEGALADGTPLPRADVAADKFPWMRWPVETWGTRAVVLAGASTADHVRAALQLLSGDVPRRTVYGHTGWREIGGSWFYLHAGGAIGADGPVAGVTVSLPDALRRFELPDPPHGPALVEAIRASLRLLDNLAPDRIAFPAAAAVYRAVLGDADFSEHLSGPSGCFKTELASLAQRHFGRDLDARHLPGSWLSTGNALEAVAFSAKDALVVVDDFAPTGSTGDVQRFHREADRLLRAQGNHAGRQRMRADGTLRPEKPPRGLILSTGEDVPRGQSLRSRMFVIEVSRSDIRPDRLTECQRDAGAGLYSQALGGFVRWLAPRYAEARDRLRQEATQLREKAGAEGQHARTPGIVAGLAIGMNYFLNFAVEAGAITAAGREDLARRCWAALGEAAVAQAAHAEVAEPAAHFMRLLAGVIASGRAHIAKPDGGSPPNPAAWGWRQVKFRGHDGFDARWEPQGRKIGWIDAEDLLLEPEAVYAEVQELARHQGEALPVSSRTLWRRMRERRLLASWDERRQRNTIRRTLEGVRDREVLHLRPEALSPCSEPSEPSTATAESPVPRDLRTVSASGPADGNSYCGGNRPQEASAAPEENRAGGRFGRSGAAETAPPEESCAPTPPGGKPLLFQDKAGRSCGPDRAARWCWEGAPAWIDAKRYPPPPSWPGGSEAQDRRRGS